MKSLKKIFDTFFIRAKSESVSVFDSPTLKIMFWRIKMMVNMVMMITTTMMMRLTIMRMMRMKTVLATLKSDSVIDVGRSRQVAS